MSPDPNDLLLFAKVIDHGSFSRAAERLGLPKSTLSRRISALEAALGERLLLRTTRQLSLTEFGSGVLEHARQIASEVDATSHFAQHRQLEISGRLRVSMPNDLANIVLAPMLERFVSDHPNIQLELDLSPRRVDLIGESFDLAVRMGDLADDASLTARRIAVFSTGLYAAPAYLVRKGMPQHPDELAEHESVRLLTRTGDAMRWNLRRDDATWEGIPPGRVAVNSYDVLLRLTCAGAGLALLVDHYAAPLLSTGLLQQVLPEWHTPAHTAWAVFPGRRLMPRRVRVFLDALIETFSAPACQAQQDRIEAVKTGARKRRLEGSGRRSPPLKTATVAEVSP